MDLAEGSSNHSSDEETNVREAEETPVIDSALCKRAQQVREKYHDDTYAWIMKTLEVTFEYFEGEELAKVVEDLTKVVEKLCSQDREYTETKLLFERFCRLNPIKSTPPAFSYITEFQKFKAAELKINKKDVESHPKYKKFLERVKELNKGKQLSETDAIAVD